MGFKKVKQKFMLFLALIFIISHVLMVKISVVQAAYVFLPYPDCHYPEYYDWGFQNLKSQTLTKAGSPYCLDGIVTLPDSETLIIEPGTVIKFDEPSGGQWYVQGAGLNLNGTVQINGTATEPVVFTSIFDDNFMADTNQDQGATEPAPGDWATVSLAGATEKNIDWAIFKYGGINNSKMINVFNGHNVVMTNSVISQSLADGLVVWSNFKKFKYNKIYENGFFGIHIFVQFEDVDVRNNWWGSAAGPRVFGKNLHDNPDLAAEDLFGNFLFDPWMSAENEPVPEWRETILPGDILYDPYTSGVGHTALYIGQGEAVEATGDPDYPYDPFLAKVLVKEISKWDYPGRKNVYLLRVKKPAGLSDEAMEMIKNNAIEFVKDQLNKPYDWGWLGKDPSPDAEKWYCSELVWAAYYNQGIDLEYSHDPLGIVSPISPSEIFLDDDTYVVDSHIEYQGGWRDYVFLMIFSPVEVVVTDSNGNMVSKDVLEIPDALYLPDYVDPQTGQIYDLISLPNIAGDYQVRVTAKVGVDPNETYSLRLKIGQDEIVLAQDVKVSDIPVEGYIISGSLGGSGSGSFSDSEESSDNTYQAGTLEAVFSPVGDFAPAVTASQISSASATVQNNGILDFQYKISTENFSGDNNLCAALNLQVSHNGIEIYHAALTNFYVATSTLAALATDNFDFTVTLPIDADLNLQNKTCSFNLKLKSWQANLDDENAGFNDEEILSFSISSGDWSATPPAPFVPGPGDVVINEIMWMGSKDDDDTLHSYDEWIELKNMTNLAIDIGQWKIANARSAGQPDLMIPASQTIPANGYYLIANYSATSADSALNVSIDEVNSSLSLANSDNGNLILKDKDGQVIDTAKGDSWPVGENGTIKKSMERNDMPGDGTLPESWHTCDRDVMTATDLVIMLSYWGSTAQNYNCGTPGHINLSVNDSTAPDSDSNYQAENTIDAPALTEATLPEENKNENLNNDNQTTTEEIIVPPALAEEPVAPEPEQPVLTPETSTDLVEF